MTAKKQRWHGGGCPLALPHRQSKALAGPTHPFRNRASLQVLAVAGSDGGEYTAGRTAGMVNAAPRQRIVIVAHGGKRCWQARRVPQTDRLRPATPS